MLFQVIILILGTLSRSQLSPSVNDFDLYSCPPTALRHNYVVSKYETDGKTAHSFCQSHGAVMPMFKSNLDMSNAFKCLNKNYSGVARKVSFLIGVSYTPTNVPVLEWEDDVFDTTAWGVNDPNGDCDSPSGVPFCCAKLEQRSSFTNTAITSTVVDSDAPCDTLSEPFMCLVPADVQILGDECALNLHNCSHTCLDALFGYTCSCPAGYTLSTSDNHTCLDIDECQNSGVCDTNTQTCVNTDGGFLCQCLQGYRNDTNIIGSCVDIDECLENNDNCLDNASCTNTVGNFQCACANGYYGDGITNCIDVDECANVSLNTCNQNCINFPGGFNCSCYDGYIANNETHCIDIDECNMTTDTCNQTCVNTEGSYSCACSAGFSLSNNSHDCLDIDECKDNATSGGLCDQICFNTFGSYQCSCYCGYFLNENGTCEPGCVNPYNDPTGTPEEATTEGLILERHKLSSYKRTKSSATDHRTSAQTIGCLGIVICISALAFIVFLDLLNVHNLHYRR